MSDLNQELAAIFENFTPKEHLAFAEGYTSSHLLPWEISVPQGPKLHQGDVVLIHAPQGRGRLGVIQDHGWPKTPIKNTFIYTFAYLIASPHVTDFQYAHIVQTVTGLIHPSTQSSLEGMGSEDHGDRWLKRLDVAKLDDVLYNVGSI